MLKLNTSTYAYEQWQLNWTLRSTLAVGVFALMALATAYASTLSVDRERRTIRAEMAEADQVQMLADYTAFMARETAATREAASDTGSRPQAGFLTVGSDQQDLLGDFVDFDFSDLKVARVMAKERDCLAKAIYFEARSEARVGQLAVADVVLNRVASRFYPSSICEVVFQGSERVTGCQFSFTCDGSMDGVRLDQRNRRWQSSVDLAGSVLAGIHVPVSREATHYHADYVDPPWAEHLSPTATIGTHKFYRFNTRRISHAAPAGM